LCTLTITITTSRLEKSLVGGQPIDHTDLW